MFTFKKDACDRFKFLDSMALFTDNVKKLSKVAYDYNCFFINSCINKNSISCCTDSRP